MCTPICANLFCAIDESPKTAEFFFQCYEEDDIEAKEYLDTEFVKLYTAMESYENHKDAFLQQDTEAAKSRNDEQWMAKMTTRITRDRFLPISENEPPVWYLLSPSPIFRL
jgi:hypothetical protein